MQLHRGHKEGSELHKVIFLVGLCACEEPLRAPTLKLQRQRAKAGGVLRHTVVSSL